MAFKIWTFKFNGLKLLKDKNMVLGLPPIAKLNQVCEGCIYGKMHRLPFPKTAWRAQAPLELVHADICGPTRTPSLNDNRYFLLFVDDYTRMMWVYFLKQKSEAFNVFLQFKAFAEKQSGSKMKTLKTDRGGKFIYGPFQKYCKGQGIQRQLTVRHTPQQNGVAKRKNRTIVEMARSMLKWKGLSNNFWAEAVNTAVYILNRSPTKAILNKTPYQAWHGQKPQVHLPKVFGCVAYAHIPKQEREKFDEKGEKNIFVGYNNESKGYCLYNPKTNKMVISRDVIFDESATWNWENDSNQGPKMLEIIEPVTNQQSSSSQSTPSASPSHSPSARASPSIGTSSEFETPPRIVCSLKEIYESSNVAFFACEPQNCNY